MMVIHLILFIIITVVGELLTDGILHIAMLLKWLRAPDASVKGHLAWVVVDALGLFLAWWLIGNKQLWMLLPLLLGVVLTLWAYGRYLKKRL